MDMISQLPDDLIVRIVSLVPTKQILALSCVSERWRSIWNLVSRLEFDDSNHDQNNDYKSFTQFVYKILQLVNKAPVLKELNLKVGPKCDVGDLRIWIDTAVAQGVRELRINIRPGSGSGSGSGLGLGLGLRLASLPRSLFKCKTLERLTLTNCSVVVSCCCLPSLEILDLTNVSFASLPKLLSGCPNLDYLRVCVIEKHGRREDMIVSSPCLRRLRIIDIRNYLSRDPCQGGVQVIEAPCLEILGIIDEVFYDSRRIENMPNLVKAYVEITQEVTHKFLRALSSVRRLDLCVSLISEVPSLKISFYKLAHLEVNTCAQGWWKLLTYMLQNSPKLTSLKLTDEHEYKLPREETWDCWKWASSIPESLNTFEWTGYSGKQRGDLAVATYVMKNACRLKTATFSPQSNCDFEAKSRMYRDLLSVSVPSPSFRLLFN